MKVDEAFAAANRLWQEVSVIVFIHAAILTLAVLGQLVSPETLTEGLLVSLASLPRLKRMRQSLQGVGLDLPFVAGALGVVYVALFQRLSNAVAHMPGFRLSYDQASLWRAGKCFDELSQLDRLLAEYSESATLSDLDVTLRLGVTQAAEQYPEHYRGLVEEREATAALWARYYSGFCLVAIASVALCAALHSPGRAFLLPIGLFVAALAARCGWEAATERIVFGRLRFALDCSIVGKKRTSVEERVSDSLAEQREAAWERADWPEGQRELLRFAEALEPVERELELAGELVKLPPPCLPFQRLWLLHGLRQIWPFKGAGAFPLMQNDVFRAWLQTRLRWAIADAARAAQRPIPADERRLRDLLGAAHPPFDARNADEEFGAAAEHGLLSEIARWHDGPPPWHRLEVPPPLIARLDERWICVANPGVVPDDRALVRLLRTRFVIRLASLVGRRLLLVDHRQNYSIGPRVQEREARREAASLRGSLRKWAARMSRTGEPPESAERPGAHRD